MNIQPPRGGFFLDPRPMIFDDDRVIIKLNQIINKETYITHRIIFYDLFTKYYKQQPILIVGQDGENMHQSGFLTLLEHLQEVFNIPDNKIVFNTVLPPLDKYRHVPVPPTFFNTIGYQMTPIENFDIEQARFVGALAASRFTVMRLRTLYELDQHFPGDTYLTLNITADQIASGFHCNAGNYQQEIDWVRNKTFDDPCVNESLSPGRILNGISASAQTAKIQNRYSIEVIMETDDYANNWFTEKTARCLAVGKPFVMMAGPGALKNLRNMGIQTFDTVIDESYDLEPVPTMRLNKIIQSLTTLHRDSHRNKMIKKMYRIAKNNIELYKQHVQSQIQL